MHIYLDTGRMASCRLKAPPAVDIVSQNCSHPCTRPIKRTGAGSWRSWGSAKGDISVEVLLLACYFSVRWSIPGSWSELWRTFGSSCLWEDGCSSVLHVWRERTLV